jgi:peptidoglycan hydrolase-like protein with peptidoglycan-binding domain
MKKTLIILGLLAAVVAAYWLAYGINPLKKIIGGSSTGENTDTSATQAATATASPGGSFKIAPAPVPDATGFPLSIGSTGQYVKNIQEALNKNYGSELVVDGIFGSKTAKALSAHGFNPDAIYWAHYYKILDIKI